MKAREYFVRGTTTDKTIFETDGTLQFVGTATVWEDLRMPLYSRGGGTAPTYTSGFAGNTNLYAWHYPTGSTRNMYFEVQMPHAWKGTTIYPHVHWAPTTVDTGSVRWILEYTWANINGTFGASSTLNMDSSVATSSQWKHILAGGNITPSVNQNGLSSMMVARLYRVGGGAGDTYAANAALLAFDIHYEIDTIGSRQETVK